MNPWVILFIALIAIWGASQQRRMLAAAKPASASGDNRQALRHSLEALLTFLSTQKEQRWVDVLTSISVELKNAETEEKARQTLIALFGGMGSLNDLTFSDPLINRQSDGLLDAVFRDAKLYHGTSNDRAQWEELEKLHKDDLAPRIKQAFRTN